MSGIKRTNTNRAKQNQYNLKGVTYLEETDTTSIDNSLNVIGDVTINSTLSVSGHVSLLSDVSMNAFVDISDGLTVVGPTSVSTLYASSDVSLNASLEVTGRLDVADDVSLNAFVSVESGLTVVGPTTVTTLVASADVSFVTNAYVGGQLLVIDDVSLNSDLYVDGSTRLVGTVTIDGSLNVNESSYTYTKTTINSVNLDVSDNIIRINVKDTSSNQTTNLPSGIMVQDVSKNVFFGYSGRKDGQEHSDKFVITKTDYDEGSQSDISLSFDKAVDVFVNGSLEVSGNVVISGALNAASMVGFAYQVVGETNDLSAGEYPFAYGAGAYDQDESFGYPILIESQLVKVGLMLSDSSMASQDASINEVIFTIGNTDVTFDWQDLSGYCEKTTNVYPTKTVAIDYAEGSMVNVKCKTLTLNNFPSRYDVVAVEKARLVMKFLTT